jgi:hypothetical protein
MSETPNERKHSVHLSVNGKILLKQILQSVRRQVVGQVQIRLEADSNEHLKEMCGLMKGG